MGNKTFNQLTRFQDNACAFQNLAGNKLLNLNLNSATTGTTTELITTSTSNQSINLPDGSGTLALDNNVVNLSTNQTVGGIKTFSASPVFKGPTNQTFPTYIPVGIHNTNKDLQAITNMASTDTAQTFLNKVCHLQQIHL